MSTINPSNNNPSTKFFEPRGHNSINLIKDEIIKSQSRITLTETGYNLNDTFYTELLYLLTPHFHEGKCVPYGYIFYLSPNRKSETESNSGVNITLLNTSSFPVENINRIIDGKNLFKTIYNNSDTSNNEDLILIKYKDTYDERELVIYAQSNNCYICFSDKYMKATILTPTGKKLIHYGRSWACHPSAKIITDMIFFRINNSQIDKCTLQKHKQTLDYITMFCLHVLVPKGIGATFVWYINNSNLRELFDSSNGNKAIFTNQKDLLDLTSLNKSCHSTDTLDALTHLFAHIDGATLLDSNGQYCYSGIRLPFNNDTSGKVFEENSGTRHNSAKKFSFENNDVIVFVVSADCRLSVYISGENIDFNASLPEFSNPDNWQEFTCTNCKGKYAYIYELEERDAPDRLNTACPICMRRSSNHLEVSNARILHSYPFTRLKITQ